MPIAVGTSPSCVIWVHNLIRSKSHYCHIPQKHSGGNSQFSSRDCDSREGNNTWHLSRQMTEKKKKQPTTAHLLELPHKSGSLFWAAVSWAVYWCLWQAQSFNTGHIRQELNVKSKQMCYSEQQREEFARNLSVLLYWQCGTAPVWYCSCNLEKEHHNQLRAVPMRSAFPPFSQPFWI